MESLDHKARKNAAMAKIRLVEAILRQWDPIGVEPGTMAPADEYDSYAPHIVSMVESGCTVEELAAHLDQLSTTTIGVGSNLEMSATFAAQIVEVVRPSNKSLERTRGELSSKFTRPGARRSAQPLGGRVNQHFGSARYWTTFVEDKADGFAGLRLHREAFGRTTVAGECIYWDATGGFTLKTVEVSFQSKSLRVLSRRRGKQSRFDERSQTMKRC